MNCNNCGKENAPGAAFCIGCGSTLHEAVIGKSDGPTAIYVSPKKKNVAALALGALSLLLAIALALSLTGVFGASGGATAASKSFGTPEDAINYFVDRLKTGDFDGALSACAIGEMAEGFDYKAYAERLNMLMYLGVSYLPSEYEQYVGYNSSKFEQQILMQMVCFTTSFNLSEENSGLIEGQNMMLQDGKLPDGLIEQLDPAKLNGLELVDIGKARMHDDQRNRENQKKQAKVYGADDVQFRTVLYKYDGNYYIGGFTVIEYGGRWLIQNMSDPLAGIPSFGTPIPVADRSWYEDMLE